ncbi:hypothetical protein [Bacteroides sp. 51]|uniref:hypothetical protein n=1 Tax=Bacteroides sp. 51 TaxID=2302938 RepID=UPI0013D2B513|nr:hypothetical protein [Bacteroides sp. 51]NDV83960.1 hypothetical protein [Bacteroides sp. 51]
MINTVVDTFRELSRKHKLIKSFYYDKNYELGEGNEVHPLFWLEEPIYAKNKGSEGGAFTITANFCILLIPTNDMDVLRCQSLALSAGLNMIEKLKFDEYAELSVLPDWTWVTLSDYYDNNASGIRFTVNLSLKNISNYCLLGEHFDDNKEFETKEVLNSFDVNAKSKCETFVNKPLSFDLKLKRK